ncbi:hypothetical protein PR048_020819 [Dryococelus australis]|uniref:DDE-1 domain-containing protein n=1 Tax=Dryococelus australis TaxID=614101 RepID=A0ABQ9GWI8_9NEOP|nr:hypothetical protein PR048_020819 [Dryococelus australis]
MSQSRAWVTKEVFQDWYINSFVPQVKQHLNAKKLPVKAVILLDNAPGHRDKEELRVKTGDGYIEALYLPENTTALIQPMDQNVIKTLKAHYKKRLLTDIVSQPNADITSLLKQFNIKNVIEALEARFTVNCDEAVSAANTLLRWCKDRGSEYEQILMLKDIQDQALTDSLRKKKQKTILDFFKVHPLCPVPVGLSRVNCNLTNNKLDDGDVIATITLPSGGTEFFCNLHIFKDTLCIKVEDWLKFLPQTCRRLCRRLVCSSCFVFCDPQELELMKDGGEVYKLIGPVLVKQELEEAKQNVSKRMDYIKSEL